METPDIAILTWLEKLTKGLRDTLVRRYIFMSSAKSDDFAMNAGEALHHFRSQIRQPDFPLRCVAQLLTVRAFFSFLLYQPDLEEEWIFELGNLSSLDTARFYHARVEWERLCQHELSDDSIRYWLQELNRKK